MESKSSRKCSVCYQIKPASDFPQTIALLSSTAICLVCQRILNHSDDDDDDSGGGGKRFEHNRGAKQLQHDLELENILSRELIDITQKKSNKDLAQQAREQENKDKIQATQREMLDQQEKKLDSKLEENNTSSDTCLNIKARKISIAHLFSVTRSLAQNRIAALNRNTATQKNMGLFAKIKEQLLINKLSGLSEKKQQDVTTHSEEKSASQEKNMFAVESSTLFSQYHGTKTENTEKLAAAIQEGQKIFKR